MKTCVTCGASKELELFSKNHRVKGGFNNKCKSCAVAATQQWYADNREYCRKKRSERYKRDPEGSNKAVRKFLKKNPHKAKQYSLKSKFDLELTTFNEMLGNQSGKCPLCETVITDKGTAVVDHDHKTGKVRALLCAPCNTALGYFKENPIAMRNGADYIEKYKG